MKNRAILRAFGALSNGTKAANTPSMVEPTVEAVEFPSLMDDTEFLAELEKLEGAPPRPSADRASHAALSTGFTAARRPVPSPSTRPLPERRQVEAGAPEPVIARDVNRWNIHSPAAIAPESTVQGSTSASAIPAFLTIMIGLCAGAVSSAVVFHERVAHIVALFAR